MYILVLYIHGILKGSYIIHFPLKAYHIHIFVGCPPSPFPLNNIGGSLTVSPLPPHSHFHLQTCTWSALLHAFLT